MNSMIYTCWSGRCSFQYMTPTTGAQRNADASAAPGAFKSNEDPAHEAAESAEREAQEDAGQKPTVP